MTTLQTQQTTQYISTESHINALPLILQQDIKIKLIKLFQGRIKHIEQEIEYAMNGKLKDLEGLININELIGEWNGNVVEDDC